MRVNFHAFHTVSWQNQVFFPNFSFFSLFTDDSDQSETENEPHETQEAIDIGKIDQVVRKMLRDQDPQDDTGYESGNSHKNSANVQATEQSGAAKIDTTNQNVEENSVNSTTTHTKLNASISVNCITSTSL